MQVKLKLKQPVRFDEIDVQTQNELEKKLRFIYHGLLDNGVSGIQEFIAKQSDVLILGMQDDFRRNAVSLLDKTGITIPAANATPAERREYVEKMFERLKQYAGGDEQFAISIYRCVMGQRKENERYDGKTLDGKEERYGLGFFVFNPILSFLKTGLFPELPYTQKSADIQMHEDNGKINFDYVVRLEKDVEEGAPVEGLFKISIGVQKTPRGIVISLNGLDVDVQYDDIESVKEMLLVIMGPVIANQLSVMGLADRELLIDNQRSIIPEINCVNVVKVLDKVLLKFDAETLEDTGVIENFIRDLAQSDPDRINERILPLFNTDASLNLVRIMPFCSDEALEKLREIKTKTDIEEFTQVIVYIDVTIMQLKASFDKLDQEQIKKLFDIMFHLFDGDFSRCRDFGDKILRVVNKLRTEANVSCNDLAQVISALNLVLKVEAQLVKPDALQILEKDRNFIFEAIWCSPNKFVGKDVGTVVRELMDLHERQQVNIKEYAVFVKEEGKVLGALKRFISPKKRYIGEAMQKIAASSEMPSEQRESVSAREAMRAFGVRENSPFIPAANEQCATGDKKTRSDTSPPPVLEETVGKDVRSQVRSDPE